MDAFPAFIPLAGKRVVIAGEGEMAEAKARLFDGSPALLVRLTIDAARAPGAFDGAALAFIAGPEAEAREIAALARTSGALVNVVDAPALGDFTTPSIIDRGRVVGAVGTDGSAPVLAVRLRQEIDARWPQRLSALAELMGVMRLEARTALPDMAQRRGFLRGLASGPVAELALSGRAAEALGTARELLAHHAPPPGWVQAILVPEAAEDLTLRQARLLGDADTVVVAGRIAPAVLALARRDAPRAAWEETTPAELQARALGGETLAVLCTPSRFGAVRRALEG